MSAEYQAAAGHSKIDPAAATANRVGALPPTYKGEYNIEVELVNGYFYLSGIFFLQA